MAIDYEYAFKALVNTIESEMMTWDGMAKEMVDIESAYLSKADFSRSHAAGQIATRYSSMSDVCAYLLKQASQFC